MIVSIINDGFQSLPVPRHQDFLHALHHSLTVNPKVYEPQSFDRFGFEQRELYRLKVVLLRPLAYTFLKTLDSDLTDKTLDKLTSFKAYRQYFDREPWLISLRPRIMLLTYTEWVDLAFRDGRSIPLPSELNG